MGQRIPKKIQAPEGVVVGQTATAKLPIGSKFHNVALNTNMPLAQMKEIRVIANNKTIHRYTAEQRDVINQFYGKPAFALVGGMGVLKIPFDRLGMKTRNMEELTALNTGAPNSDGSIIKSLYIEIDISDDTSIAGYTAAPKVDVWATVSAAEQAFPGTVLHCVTHNRNPAGSGEFEVSDLPFNKVDSQALNAAFIFPDANDITRIIVERGLYKVFDRTKAVNEFFQVDGSRNPQAGCIAIDMTENGYGANALDLRGYQDFRYRLDMTGAATLTFVSEYLGQLGQ